MEVLLTYVEKLSAAKVVLTGTGLGMGLQFLLFQNWSLLFLPSVWVTVQTL